MNLLAVTFIVVGIVWAIYYIAVCCCGSRNSANVTGEEAASSRQRTMMAMSMQTRGPPTTLFNWHDYTNQQNALGQEQGRNQGLPPNPWTVSGQVPMAEVLPPKYEDLFPRGSSQSATEN